jgi:hypothetical protein
MAALPVAARCAQHEARRLQNSVASQFVRVLVYLILTKSLQHFSFAADMLTGIKNPVLWRD